MAISSVYQRPAPECNIRAQIPRRGKLVAQFLSDLDMVKLGRFEQGRTRRGREDCSMWNLHSDPHLAF